MKKPKIQIGTIYQFNNQHILIIEQTSDILYKGFLVIKENTNNNYKNTYTLTSINRIKNMYQKTGQRNLKSLEVHFSCQEKVSFRMKIN